MYTYICICIYIKYMYVYCKYEYLICILTYVIHLYIHICDLIKRSQNIFVSSVDSWYIRFKA